MRRTAFACGTAFACCRTGVPRGVTSQAMNQMRKAELTQNQVFVAAVLNSLLQDVPNMPKTAPLKTATSQKARADGRFAIDGGTEWVADFESGQFWPDKFDRLRGQGVWVLNATNCNAPGWCGHGSTFKYAPERDAWEEYDHKEQVVTRTWTRVGPARGQL